jgi:hypothetical protein
MLVQPLLARGKRESLASAEMFRVSSPCALTLCQQSHRADPAVVLDERRTAALSELRLFRDSLASLQARIPNLEHFIANSGPAEGDDKGDMPYLSSFGNPMTKLAPSKEEDAPAPSTSRRRVEDLEAGEPDRKRIKEGTPSTEPEENDSAAVETTVDLEFMVSLAVRLPSSSELISCT